jgi:hypothetical protein
VTFIRFNIKKQSIKTYFYERCLGGPKSSDFWPTIKPFLSNKSKEPKYGTPEDCITGILENSEQLQAIIKKDWKKLEQFNKKQHDFFQPA